MCPHPSSNNIAEFFGFRASLRRALRLAPPRLVFELDSLLLVMMMSGKWGCHRQHLRVLLAECYDLGEQLPQAGCDWSIWHVTVNITASRTNSRGIASVTPAKRTSPPRGDTFRGLQPSRAHDSYHMTYGVPRPEDTLTTVAPRRPYQRYQRGCMYAAVPMLRVLQSVSFLKY